MRLVRRIAIACAPLALALSLVAPAAAAPGAAPLTAPDPDHVSFTLEGCKLPAAAVLPPSLLCLDSQYTTGNLGKSWNELDLVPHRVTSNAGNAAPATQTFSIAITADYLEGGVPGYDVIGTPVLNTSKSHASCTLSSGAQTVLTPGVGGTDSSLYRILTISQPKNSTCVVDYVERLALGSHLYPGASLHSNLMNQAFGTQGIGAKDVSIPVNEISPQELSKTMTATQGADHVWNVTKSPSPASLDFGDTCLPGAPLSLNVQITISWTKSPAIPTAITVVTNIYATNPAHRTITTTVTDAIRSGTTVLDTAGPVTANVPPNTTGFLLLTHTATLPAGTTDINDVATATYTDLITNIPVPGQTTASATATVQVTETNATATITDSESITGTGLSFSVAAPSVGAFTGGYVAGTPTTGPVGWSSGVQNASGSATFDKTVYLDQRRATSGALSDSAQLTGSDGFSASASLSVGIQSSALVSLTINKTIPAILQTGETQSFTFDVTGAGYANTPSISFGAGETSKSLTLNGLQPGSYTVAEQATAGWVTAPSQTVTIALPDCSASVSIANAFGPATARAQKVTVPAGNESGWELTLSGPGGPETVITTGAGYVTFALALQEGSYTITETPKTGFDLTGTSGECSFTVNYPADADRLYSCTFTNTERGKILVRKLTDPASDTTTSFSFTTSGAGYAAFSLKNGETNDSGLLVPGLYSVAENVPAGWDLTSATCDQGNTPAAIDLDPGQTVTCLFNDRQRGTIIVRKITDPASDTTTSFAFTTTGAGYAGFSLKNGESNNSGFLVPGAYSVSETVPAGWDLVSSSCDGDNTPAAIDLGAGETVTCVFVNRQRGTIIVRKITDPASDTTTSFSFTTTGAGYAGFSLKNGESNNSGFLVPGAYSVSETIPAGWDLVSSSCDGGNTPAAINLAAGQTVTCEFVNRQRGTIIVRKITNPASDTTTSFTFTTTGGGYAGFSLKNGESNDSGFLVPGTYSVAETVPVGWDLVSATCTNGENPAAIDLGAGETVTCTFVNRQRGHIIVIKRTDPAGSSQSFTFTTTGAGYAGFSLTDGQSNDSGALVPGAYSVAETAVTGWDLISATCTGGQAPASINLGAGQTITCTFVNRQRGKAQVIKTVVGLPPSGDQAFIFQLRQGASVLNVGTTLESLTANAANGGVLNFTTLLVPGQTYQLCEIVMPGWLTSLGTFVPDSFNPPDGVVPNPNVDNSILCVNFTVSAGETKIFTVDNTPPPGGRALTIGFWKNWSSCSGGRQDPVLDNTIYEAEQAGTPITIGDLVLHAGSNPDRATDCLIATRILNKSDKNNGKKMSSDPAYNLAAQLLATRLNFQAGAGKCGAAIAAADQAQALLDAINFTGTGAYANTMTTAQKNLANSLAKTLDDYNNNRLC